MACDQSEKVHLFQNFLSLAPTFLVSVGEPFVTPTSSGWLGGTFEAVRVLLGFLGGGGLRVLWGRLDGGVGMALGGFAGSILAVERGFSAGEGLARRRGFASKKRGGPLEAVWGEEVFDRGSRT